MTTDKSVDVNMFVTTLMDYAYGSVKRAFDGLTQEQLHHQPTPDTNSMAWLAWHLNRWKDRQSALATGDEEVWTSGGWNDKFGMPAERTGLGDTSEQVSEFNPSPELLWGYIDAAHQRFLERVASMSPEDLEKPVHYIPGRGEPRPAWRSLYGACSDAVKHTGQIEYLRGLITGKGWFGA
mgnify:FL=1|tara:strand:+ start:1775 stop:2314 length:540 start_codon:yes stop_codon:yes gene_type:complete